MKLPLTQERTVQLNDCGPNKFTAYTVKLLDADGVTIADIDAYEQDAVKGMLLTTKQEAEEAAAYIVRAVNSYEARKQA